MNRLSRNLIAGLIFSAYACLAGPPPQTDYCEMLARDIQGKQYAFLAGNHMYYIGGKVDEWWRPVRSETIGLSHPIFRDGRARGYGIATGAGGKGHDKWGWEFWNHVRGPVGTVIIDGQRYPKPEPESMIWRPDRVVCQYSVGGVAISETKFVARNDVLCSTVTASAPIRIEYSGASFYFDDELPTWDDDAPGKWMSELSTTANFADNALRIVERGAMMTKLDWQEPAVKGRMMYDGMSVVISASRPFAAQSIRREDSGAQAFTLTLDYPANTPVTLSYAQADDPAVAESATRSVLADPAQALADKHLWFNGLLNSQIPYFRCSDESVVKTYYYLWALYFMYFTHTGEGYESYPHTQTAINNFMGLHVWDSWAYTAMGSWVVDGEQWGYGNILSWKHMVPFKDPVNAVPDNFGTTWYSPKVWMPLVGAVGPAWEMYEKSGDRAFLQVLYNDLFKPLYWDGKGPQASFGSELNALTHLQNMARELGQDEDLAHWEGFRPRMRKNFLKDWEGYAPNYMASQGEPWMDIWQLNTLLCEAMPVDWAQAMSRDWIMNSEQGFLGPVSVRIRPPQHPPNGVFRVSTISTWLVIEGMFRKQLKRDAVLLTLNHIKAMNKDYGFPVAPECWDPNDKPWGSLYYAWDGPITDLLLKRIAGISFSVPDKTFTVDEAMPEEWSFLHVKAPVEVDGEVTWVDVRIDREKGRKTVKVKDAPKGFAVETLPWERVARPLPTYAAVTPAQREFFEPITVTLHNLQPTSILRYTSDGSDPTADSPLAPTTMNIDRAFVLKLRNFEADGTAHSVMSVPFSRVALSPAADLASKPGLRVSAYRGEWKSLPAVAAPDASTLRPTITPMSLDGRATDYALSYDGYVELPQDGLYTFRLVSDDGSRLKIDGKTVAEINILCDRDPWTKDGSIALKKGLHKLVLLYFQAKTNTRLTVSYRINNAGDFRELQADQLFHAEVTP
jgi:hypothetical protein